MPRRMATCWGWPPCPKALAKDVVDRVWSAAKKALAMPEVRKRIEETGSLVVGGTPAEFAQQIKEEFAIYLRVVKTQKLTLE